MKCPACENELATKNIEDITVDVCNGGCGGVWFDNFEFKKFDEPHESAGETLLDISVNESLNIEYGDKRGCPKCPDIIMRRHFFSVKRKTEIDECPTCGGIWLDAGELRTIRSSFESEEEKDKASDEYLNEVFSGDFARARQESEEQRAKINRFANMFRFFSSRR